MKIANRITVIVIAIITILPCAYAKKSVLNSYAPRDKKAMDKLWKEIGIRENTPKYVYSWKFSYFNEEVYLRNLPETKRNLIENNLLERYKEVIIIKKIPQWYFVVDNAGDVGIYNVDGTLFCPPIPGKIHIFKSFSFMTIGDITDLPTLKKQIDEFISGGIGSPTGSCAAVANWKKRTFIIPYGEYIDIAFARKTSKNHYYVAKLDEHNELKWGITNHNGKLTVPCEYRAVGLKGGFFLGSSPYPVHIGGKYRGRNDMSMDEFSKTNRSRLERAKERAQSIANILMPIGETLVSVAGVLPDNSKTHSSSNSDSYGTTQNNSILSSSAAKNNEDNKSITTTAFNTDRNTYHKCESLLINMDSNSAYDYSDEIRKDTQRQMRQIREKWERKGYKISQSIWETWGGK